MIKLAIVLLAAALLHGSVIASPARQRLPTIPIDPVYLPIVSR